MNVFVFFSATVTTIVVFLLSHLWVTVVTPSYPGRNTSSFRRRKRRMCTFCRRGLSPSWSLSRGTTRTTPAGQKYVVEGTAITVFYVVFIHIDREHQYTIICVLPFSHDSVSLGFFVDSFCDLRIHQETRTPVERTPMSSATRIRNYIKKRYNASKKWRLARAPFIS